MSATIASGASKPNGAGLPMLSLRIRWPSASSRWASTRIGPRTSYRTLWSFLLCRIGSHGRTSSQARVTTQPRVRLPSEQEGSS